MRWRRFRGLEFALKKRAKRAGAASGRARSGRALTAGQNFGSACQKQRKWPALPETSSKQAAAENRKYPVAPEIITAAQNAKTHENLSYVFSYKNTYSTSCENMTTFNCLHLSSIKFLNIIPPSSISSCVSSFFHLYPCLAKKSIRF